MEVPTASAEATLSSAAAVICGVCRDTFAHDDGALVTLPACQHTFCATCLGRWTRQHETCPLCRGAVHLDARSEKRVVDALEQWDASIPPPPLFSLGWDPGFPRPVRPPSPWVVQHPAAVHLSVLETSDPLTRTVLETLWSGQMCAACSWAVHQDGTHAGEQLAWTRDSLTSALAKGGCCPRCRQLITAHLAPPSTS